jgi:hypothetical protein
MSYPDEDYIPPRFIIKTADGQYIGKMVLTAPLGPVSRPFAYVYDNRMDAEQVAALFLGSTVERWQG